MTAYMCVIFHSHARILQECAGVLEWHVWTRVVWQARGGIHRGGQRHIYFWNLCVSVWWEAACRDWVCVCVCVISLCIAAAIFPSLRAAVWLFSLDLLLSSWQQNYTSLVSDVEQLVRFSSDFIKLSLGIAFGLMGFLSTKLPWAGCKKNTESHQRGFRFLS